MLRTFMLVLLMLAVATVVPVRAQDASVQASASTTTAGENEAVTYTLEVSGARFSEIETPDPPRASGLALEQRTPRTQRKLSYVDGTLERRAVFEWQYRPLRTGTATFYPATVTVAGASYETEAIDLRIVPQSQRPMSRDPDPAQPALDAGDLFIRAVPSDTQVYRNEQLTLTYRLYFREALFLQRTRLAGSWDAPGFWREELEVAPHPVPRIERIGEQRYQTIVLKRVALFPTRAGTLVIDPLRIETRVRGASPNPFQVPLPQEVQLASDTVRVEVLPLPDGAPPEFNGAVGSFEIDSRLAPTEVEAGEAATLRMRFTGTGNLALLEAPPVDVPDAFEVYDPEEQTTLMREGRQLRGWKTFTYALVPQEGGAFVLPPVRFTYFDPEAERYETLRARLPLLDVTGTGPPEPARARAEDVLPAEPGEDDLGLLTNARWERTPSGGGLPLHRSPWTYAALLAPALLLAAFALYRRRAQQAEAETSPEAPPAAAHLKRARAAMNQGDQDALRRCYDALERALHAAITAATGQSAHTLRRDEVDALLRTHDVGPEARRTARAVLDACDRARFAPTTPNPATARADCDRAASVMAALP